MSSDHVSKRGPRLVVSWRPSDLSGGPSGQSTSTRLPASLAFFFYMEVGVGGGDSSSGRICYEHLLLSAVCWGCFPRLWTWTVGVAVVAAAAVCRANVVVLWARWEHSCRRTALAIMIPQCLPSLRNRVVNVLALPTTPSPVDNNTSKAKFAELSLRRLTALRKTEKLMRV
ncbi:uncharacterized protein J3D65DRAFT_456859 [Phyllosticta citribraziliensis]|uniref:Uncharacterized protein n=1 Tax=Phyllosticta citribraziliensis TaxID=989973 RepID=A0ABR1LJA2_9PEZI